MGREDEKQREEVVSRAKRTEMAEGLNSITKVRGSQLFKLLFSPFNSLPLTPPFLDPCRCFVSKHIVSSPLFEHTLIILTPSSLLLVHVPSRRRRASLICNTRVIETIRRERERNEALGAVESISERRGDEVEDGK